jgi:O-antigen ligase
MATARAQWPLGGMLLALCAAIGLLAGIAPGLAIGAALAAGFATLVAADLTVGLCVFIVVSFAERVPAAGTSDLTLVKALGALLAVSWLGSVATRRAGERQLFTVHPAMAAAGALLLAWMILSITWAEDPAVARTDVMRYALNLSLLPIVYSAVRRREHVIAVLGVYVAGAVFSALYAIAIAGGGAGEAYDRISGVAGTANELASLLVTALFLAGGLLLALRGSPAVRVMLAAAMGVCLVGLFLTLSRAGLVALAAALVAGVFVGGRRRAGVAVLILVVGLSTVGYFSFAASKQARERVTTLGSGTGRTDIWTVAWRMVGDDPVRGVGVGNFQTASIHFLLRPGAIQRDEFIVDRPQVAHNSYLQVVAELGVPGLVLFAGLIVAGLLAGWRAAREFTRRGDTFMETCARGVVLALIALLVADFFASDQLNKELWLLLGLGPALLGIARREPV